MAMIGLNGQAVDVDEFCNAVCRSFSDCEFFQVAEGEINCILFRGPFDESFLSRRSDGFIGVPCCPVQGYVIYSGNAINSPDLLLDIVELGQGESGDNCNSVCSLRRECGYFHVANNNCVMFRGAFRHSLLSSDDAAFVGVPCEMENSTEDPSEAPTEAPTETPIETSTEPTPAPNDCPTEGYFKFPETTIRGDIIGLFLLNGQGVDVVHYCNAVCNSLSDCGFFRVVPDDNRCRIFRGSFNESLLSHRSDAFVGVPCCPTQGYFIYSGSAINSPDLLLDIVELGQEESGDNCNSECSLRRECGYFSRCRQQLRDVQRPISSGAYLSRNAAAFVGVPCGIGNPTEDPSEASTEAPTETPTVIPTLAPTGPTAGPNDCPPAGYFAYA